MRVKTWPAGQTVGARLAETGGRPTGFDNIRIFLACVVIFGHTKNIMGVPFALRMAGMNDPHPNFLKVVGWAVIPSFFALSGFLVSTSLVRAKTRLEFVMLRVLRIVPALAIETLLWVFILGPIVTVLPLKSYFTRSELWSYLLNIVGYIHYTLPGVYVHNPVPRIVNHQLWTLPFDLICYGILLALALIGWAKSPRVALVIVGVAAVVPVITKLLGYGPGTWPLHAHPEGWAVMFSFGVGLCIYHFRDRIPLSLPLVIASVIATWAFMQWGPIEHLACIPIAYLTIFAGLTNYRRYIGGTADYSYGTYLYGFPVQQALTFFFPGIHSFLLHFAISLTAALILARFSWVYVESKVMEKRKSWIGWVQRAFDASTARIRTGTRGLLGPSGPVAAADAEH